MILSSPFENAYWLRLPNVVDLDERDRRFQCRKTFTLRQVPRQALVHVTADAKYTLYVNGKFAGFGPARGYQRQWCYDTLDIASLLRKGKNVIAAQVHKFGLGMMSYAYANDNGFLLSGNIGGVDVSTNGSWVFRHSPGYTPAVARAAAQYGFQEFLDCRQCEDNWFGLEYREDASWQVDFAKDHLRKAGCAPWDELIRREVPLLTFEERRPASIVACSRHVPHSSDMSEKRHLYHHYIRESFRWKPCAQSANQLVFDRGIHGYVVDLGEEMPCRLQFQLQAEREGDVLEFACFERLAEDGLSPDFPNPGKDPHPRTFFAGQLILKKGPFFHELSEPWGMRYVVLWTNADKLKVTLGARTMFGKIEMTGSLKTTDQMLQGIWDMCLQTQRCCMVDGYIDCPWRENAQWWGDAVVQAANTFRITDNSSLLSRGVQLVGSKMTPTGLTYGVAPTDSPLNVMPDYSLFYLVSLHQLYYQTGSLERYWELRSVVTSILDYFRQGALWNGNGLTPYDQRYTPFFDHCPGLYRGRTSTLLNMIWLYSLKKVAELAYVANDAECLRQVRADISQLEKAACRLVGPETKLLYDGLDERNEPVNTHCAHAAAMAILADFLPQCHDKWARKILLPLVKGDHHAPMTPTTYFMYYVFEALKKTGYRREVIDCIQRWWGEMVEAGCSTTPEVYLDEATRRHLSFCHAWSAHPLVHFSEILLGVTQLAPRWQKVRLEPLFIKGVDVSGTVPTPRGNIEVDIRWNGGQKSFTYRVPEGIEVVQ